MQSRTNLLLLGQNHLNKLEMKNVNAMFLIFLSRTMYYKCPFFRNTFSKQKIKEQNELE